MGVIGPAVGQGLSREPDHQPGRDHHGDEEGEDHRRRGVDRDRRHIGAHQPRNEQHGQQGRHHGQGRHDGGVADLRHRLDSRLRSAAAVAHPPVTGDVLDHDDGVVDQDADGEDQGEQADAIDRIAHDIGGEEGQQDGGGNDHGGDGGLAPADGEADRHDDRHGRQGQVEQQFVGLFVRRLAVVAADGDLDPLGDQLAFQVFDALTHGLGHHHRIGAGAFGDGEADGGRAGPLTFMSGPAPDASLVFAGPLGHVCDVAQIDRRAGDGSDGQQPDLLGRGQGAAGGDGDGLTVLADIADGEAAVGLGRRLHHLAQGHAVQVQLGRIGGDADFVGPAAGDEGQAHVVDLGDLGAQLVRQVIEGLIGPLARRARLGREGQDDGRHVVDAAHRHLGIGNAHRDPVLVGAELFFDPYGGVLGV